jgi:hypothetical protein
LWLWRWHLLGEDRGAAGPLVFETFAKTVDTFVASCKDDKRPIAHQISSQVVNFIFGCCRRVASGPDRDEVVAVGTRKVGCRDEIHHLGANLVCDGAAITERLDAKAREAKLLREVFETFAKTVDTFVASCKDDKRPIAHQISSQVVNFISTTYFASTDVLHVVNDTVTICTSVPERIDTCASKLSCGP